LGDGDGVISDCFRNFYLFNVNSSKQVIFLFLHVVVMLGIVIAMLENILTTLGGRMAIMHTLFASLGVR